MTIQAKTISERVAKLEEEAKTNPSAGVSRSTFIMWLVGIAITVVITAIAATHMIDGEISDKYNALDQRMTKAESAIKALASQQTTQTQNLIQNLLATAKSSENDVVATRAAATAVALTKTLQKDKQPAQPEFFRTTMTDLNSIEPRIGNQAFALRHVLAEYRSSITPIATPGTVFECPGPAAPGHEYAFQEAGSLENITIKNCTYILDDRTLTNVAFIDTQIIYHRGALRLNHVLFVNCTFSVAPDRNGSDLLEYAALDSNQLTVGKPGF